MPADESERSQTERVMEALEETIIFDLCAAYKKRLESSGFSPEAAEAMTIDFHRSQVL